MEIPNFSAWLTLIKRILRVTTKSTITRFAFCKFVKMTNDRSSDLPSSIELIELNDRNGIRLLTV